MVSLSVQYFDLRHIPSHNPWKQSFFTNIPRRPLPKYSHVDVQDIETGNSTPLMKNKAETINSTIAKPIQTVDSLKGWPQKPQKVQSSTTDVVLDWVVAIGLLICCSAFLCFALLVWAYEQALVSNHEVLARGLIRAATCVITTAVLWSFWLLQGSYCLSDPLRLCFEQSCSPSSSLAIGRRRTDRHSRYSGWKYLVDKHCKHSVEAVILQYLRCCSAAALDVITSRWSSFAATGEHQIKSFYHQCENQVWRSYRRCHWCCKCCIESKHCVWICRR